MKTYKAKKKEFVRYLLIGSVILPFAIVLLGKEVFFKIPPLVTILLLSPTYILICLLAWVYFDTYYQIENGQLRYKSAFIKGKIDICTIKKVTSGKTMWAGIKPALATKGLIIQYNRFDEIYIAPESNNEIMIDLLALNKNIEVIK